MRVSKMPLGGKVDICFFDKTGTLTNDEIELEGVGGHEYFIYNISNIPFIDFSELSNSKTSHNINL